MSIDAIHHLLNAWNMPRLSAQEHVYDLRKHTWLPFVGGARLHERQIEILRRIRELPWTVYLGCDEDPHDWELTGHWTQEGPHTWVMPRDHGSAELLEGYLAAGGWSIYLASYPLAVTEMPNIFDMRAAEICAFTRAHSMPVLVQAFYDNAEWRVALEPAVVPAAAAA